MTAASYSIRNARSRLSLDWHLAEQMIAPSPSTVDTAMPPVRAFIQQLTIEDPQHDGTAIIPFDLWPAQERVLHDLHTYPRLIILKSRQLGITWLSLAYALHLCLASAGRTVLCFSQGLAEANELVRRVRGMWERYPDAKPDLITDNTQHLTWSNGSTLRSIAATERAGRSFTASLVLLDEAAFMRAGPAVYRALRPTIDNGGKLIIISTANGDDPLFAPLWAEATAGANDLTPIFLPWTAHPERDAAWYAQVETGMVSSADMQREYPTTPEDAFTEASEERFIDMLLWDRCAEVLPPPTAYEPMVLAADAGVVNDHFGLVLVSRHPRDPEASIAVRLAREYVPNGAALDFDMIEQDIRSLCASFNVIDACYDPYQLHQMMTRLHHDGIVLTTAFSQGAQRARADKGLYDLIMQRRIGHDGTAALRAAIDNANRRPDDDQQLRIVKRTAAKKIDLAVALSMAAYRCLELPL